MVSFPSLSDRATSDNVSERSAAEIVGAGSGSAVARGASGATGSASGPGSVERSTVSASKDGGAESYIFGSFCGHIFADRHLGDGRFGIEGDGVLELRRGGCCPGRSRVLGRSRLGVGEDPGRWFGGRLEFERRRWRRLGQPFRGRRIHILVRLGRGLSRGLVDAQRLGCSRFSR